MTVRRAPEAMIFENDGGQCSLERTRLPINSLLSGNFAGSFRETRNLAPLGDGINRGFAGRLGTTLPNTRNREREPSIREGSVGGTLQELARTGQILAGHARFEAAHQGGQTIVGEVQTATGMASKSEDRTHAIAHAPEPALRSAFTQNREARWVAGDEER